MQFTYPQASIKDAQATGEVFSPQKWTSSTLKDENSVLFYFFGSFFPSWIRIRIQQLKLMRIRIRIRIRNPGLWSAWFRSHCLSWIHIWNTVSLYGCDSVPKKDRVRRFWTSGFLMSHLSSGRSAQIFATLSAPQVSQWYWCMGQMFKHKDSFHILLKQILIFLLLLTARVVDTWRKFTARRCCTPVAKFLQVSTAKAANLPLVSLTLSL